MISTAMASSQRKRPSRRIALAPDRLVCASNLDCVRLRVVQPRQPARGRSVWCPRRPDSDRPALSCHLRLEGDRPETDDDSESWTILRAALAAALESTGIRAMA